MQKNKFGLIILIILIALVFTACNEVEFTVQFVVDGEFYDAITTNANESISMPRNPQKEGYAFDGWYLDEDIWNNNFTANYLLDSPNPESVTVYAKWKPLDSDNNATYTILFDSNGGSAIDALTEVAGTTISEPEKPKRLDFIFDGWYTDNGTFNDSYIFTSMPEENITLYAKWMPTKNQTVSELRHETDVYFEVDSLNSVKYTFDVTDFLLLEILIYSDDIFNVSLVGSDGEIKNYQTDRVMDSLLLENGGYSLLISKHEQDTTVTTNIAHQEIINDGEVSLNEESPLRLLKFDIEEEYDYIVLLSFSSEDILYNVYDKDRTLLYENQTPGAVHDFDIGEYYFLFRSETNYNGKASIAKKSQALNTSRENAEQLVNSAATGQIDVPGTQLYYSFTVETDGSLVLVQAYAEDGKHIVVNVTDSNNKAVVRAGLKSAINPSSADIFDNEAKGEYVLPKGEYYLRVNLGTGLTGSFSVSAGIPNITNTNIGGTHSFNVSANTNYYFRIHVPEKSYVYFNTYLSDSADRYFPLTLAGNTCHKRLSNPSIIR